MTRIDLVTLGEAFEDLVFLGLSRLPSPGQEEKTSRFLRTIGGGAVITAVAAARLGTRCRVVSGIHINFPLRFPSSGSGFWMNCMPATNPSTNPWCCAFGGN